MAFILAWPVTLLAWQRAQKPTLKAMPVVGATSLKYWPSSSNMLSALVEMGSKNQIPIGIVIEGDSLCTARPTSSDAPSTINDLMVEIKSQIPGYTAEIRDNTLFVHPKAMTAPTIDVLNLLIPSFRTDPENVHAIQIALWMYIRAVLVPQQGSAFEGEIPEGAEVLPSIQMSNSTVEEILDRVVTVGQGGLWIMHKVPVTWSSNPTSIPYGLYSYSGQQEDAEKIRCLR